MEIKLLGDGAGRRKESRISLAISEREWRDYEYEEKSGKYGNSL